MSLLDVTVSGLGVGQARASFDVGRPTSRWNDLVVGVTAHGKFRRVVVSAHGRGTPVTLLLPTYFDVDDGDVLTPHDVAQKSPRRMHAHTLHGSDVRRMLDTGTYTYEHGAVI